MTATPVSRSPYAIVPLGPDARDELRTHLLALDAADRCLRFGVAADDESVGRYVASIDFAATPVLAARDPLGCLLGMAHVALAGGVADLGLSVAAEARGRGVATALARAALREAGRRGAREFRIDYAADNDAMTRLVQRLGMQVEREGSDCTARRRLARSAPAALPASVTEAVAIG